MVQHGATWCKMVQDSEIPCITMQYHAIPCKTMPYHAILCNIMQYHAIQCNTMQYLAIPCNTMQYNAIPCNAMQYHASLITADGAYHCPVGSIMAIFSSVRSSYSHPDLLLIHHHQPHFFRSHRSSTVDFHFLSHYSYIKAIMLYKAITGLDVVASWMPHGFNWASLMMTWGHLGHYLRTTCG